MIRYGYQQEKRPWRSLITCFKVYRTMTTQAWLITHYKWLPPAPRSGAIIEPFCTKALLPMMNLGYACINLTLAEEGVTTNRGMIRKTFLEKGIAYASELALSNVLGLQKILEWNVANNISVFRVTSDLFPWASEYSLTQMPHYREIRDVLEACGKLPVRISSHPGPFNKVAGAGATLANTIKDLEIHSQVFDLMNLEASPQNKINIHVGGAYGDKDETLKRFAQNFGLLSNNLKARLTIENDDKPGLYTVQQLASLHEMIGIPIVFDYFHHRLHPGTQTEEEAFTTAYKTWSITPVFHFSSSRRDYENPEAKKEAHSDWVHEKINTYGRHVDVMLETKMKELSLLKYQQQNADDSNLNQTQTTYTLATAS